MYRVIAKIRMHIRSYSPSASACYPCNFSYVTHHVVQACWNKGKSRKSRAASWSKRRWGRGPHSEAPH